MGRDNAEAAKIKKAISSYVTAISSYYIDHKEYPVTVSEFGTCLGHGPCMELGFEMAEDPVLMQNLDPYIKGTPEVSTRVFSVYFEDDDVTLDFKGARYACYNHPDWATECGWMRIEWVTPIKSSSIPHINEACAIPEASVGGKSYPMSCSTKYCWCAAVFCPDGSRVKGNLNCSSSGSPN